MVYLDWRIGRLSGGVDEDFEQFEDELLRISDSCIISSSYQYIVSKISVDIDLGNYDLIAASILIEEEHDHWIM